MKRTVVWMFTSLALLAALTASLAADSVKDAEPIQRWHESSLGEIVKTPGDSGAIGQGYLVYAKWCAGCHAPDNPLAPGVMVGQYAGTYVLQQRYQGAMPAVLQERTNLTAPVIAFYVRNGLNTMPGFRKTEISDAELAVLTAYLTRNNPQ